MRWLALLLVAGCGASEGGRCQASAAACGSSTAILFCEVGTWTQYECPGGCVDGVCRALSTTQRTRCPEAYRDTVRCVPDDARMASVCITVPDGGMEWLPWACTRPCQGVDVATQCD